MCTCNRLSEIAVIHVSRPKNRRPARGRLRVQKPTSPSPLRQGSTRPKVGSSWRDEDQNRPQRKRRLSKRVNPEGRGQGEQTSAIVAYCTRCVRDRRIVGQHQDRAGPPPARPCVRRPQFAPELGPFFCGPTMETDPLEDRLQLAWAFCRCRYRPGIRVEGRPSART
jgi:hypothetical protein